MISKSILLLPLVVGLVVAAPEKLIDEDYITCEPESSPPVCPSTVSYPMELPHQNSCSKYYKCFYGKLELYECPQGLHYSKKYLCTVPEKANCKCADSQPFVPTIPPATPGSCNKFAPAPLCSDESITLPHHYDCSKYHQCHRGRLYDYTCPNGLHYVPGTESTCTKPENSNCKPCCDPSSPVPTCPKHDPNDPVVHLAHQNDCTKFYTCDWGVPQLTNCAAGLHFNPVLEVCDWPEKAGCNCANF